MRFPDQKDTRVVEALTRLEQTFAASAIGGRDLMSRFPCITVARGSHDQVAKAVDVPFKDPACNGAFGS